MVTILVGDKNRVDFKFPVDAEYEEDLRGALEDIFDERVVELNETESLRGPDKRVGKMKAFPREWSGEEKEILCNYHRDEDEVAEMIGRSHMAVKNRRATEMAQFRRWLEQEGKELPEDVDKLHELVETYVKEQDMLKEKKKELEKRNRELRKLIENKEETIVEEKGLTINDVSGQQVMKALIIDKIIERSAEIKYEEQKGS